MSANTTIEWTDRTWNPVRGCSLVSAGCANCYAMKFAHRFSGKGRPYEGLTEIGPRGPRWTGRIRLVPEALEEPLRWKKPQRIFVNSMSDLFHEDVPDTFILECFKVMKRANQHTYQLLTKRPERMCDFVRRIGQEDGQLFLDHIMGGMVPHLDHIWLGISVEDQHAYRTRVPYLTTTPAAVRFISFEPVLEDIGDLMLDGVFGSAYQWAILGGESGPGARPCDLAWLRSIKDQCQAARVKVFIKQVGKEPRGVCDWEHHDTDPPKWLDEHGTLLTVSGAKTGDLCHAIDDSWWPCKPKLKDKKGGAMFEWPQDLRVREWPR